MQIEELKAAINKNLFGKNGAVKPNINTKYAVEIEHIINLTHFISNKENITLAQRLWHILNDVYYAPVCDNNQITNFNDIKKGYFNFCCDKKCPCRKLVREKIKRTNVEKYGFEYGFQSESVKAKIIQTNLINYGVENISQSNVIKEKKIKTSLKNYGVEYGAQSEIVKNKNKNNNLEKYGAPSHTQNIL